MHQADSDSLLTFDGFAIDERSELLLRDGESIRLRPKSFATLCYLARNPGRVVSKQELFDAIWGSAVVTDDSLTQCLVDIRRALGDANRHLVTTVPKRGYRFDARPGPAPSQPAIPGRFPLRRVVTASALVFIVLAIIAAIPGIRDETEQPVAANGYQPTPVVAVLPFEDLTAEGDSAYLARGLADEMATRLAQFDGLRVIARNSSFSPGLSASMSSAEKGRQLGASHLVEGSVRQQGDVLRVTVQLVDAVTGTHLWSRSFDKAMHDLLRLQDQLANAVGEVFQLSVLEAPTHLAHLTDGDFERYLRAIHLLRDGELSALGEARLLLEGIWDRNPGHLPSARRLPGIYLKQILLGRIPSERGTERVREISAELKTLPGGEGPAEAALGELALKVENDLATAAMHMGRAVQLEPNNPHTLMIAGELAHALGRFSDAAALFKHVAYLDPLCITCRIHLAHTYAAAGNYDQAERAVREFMKHSRGGDFSLAYIKMMQRELEDARTILAKPLPPGIEKFREFYLALVTIAAGDVTESDLAIAEFARKYGDEERLRLAQLYAWAGRTDDAIAQLARLRAEDAPALLAELHSPLWLELRDQAGWQALLKAHGRAPEQMAEVDFDIARLAP